MSMPKKSYGNKDVTLTCPKDDCNGKVKCNYGWDKGSNLKGPGVGHPPSESLEPVSSTCNHLEDMGKASAEYEEYTNKLFRELKKQQEEAAKREAQIQKKIAEAEKNRQIPKDKVKSAEEYSKK